MNGKDIERAKMLANRYGSANCWTGSSGSLASELKRCILYIEGLEVDSKEVKAQPGSEVLLEAFRLVNQDRENNAAHHRRLHQGGWYSLQLQALNYLLSRQLCFRLR